MGMGGIYVIDVRSDTVTKPTEEMRKAAYEAEVGDDVYREDPTVNRLEEKAAEILGKEAALFVTSGVQGNQIAVLTHCRPGNEILLEENSHLFYYEGGAISAFAGVQPRTIRGNKGSLNAKDVEMAIRGDDIHFPETGLICIENTHNRAGGAIIPIENMKSVYEVARQCGVPVHLDGARLFNAVVATGIPASEYAKYTDTVQVCLSKGLGAPVGSVIAGSRDFIERARKWRKRLGGGLRQSGIIAAPALYALTNMVERLSEDHEKAKYLAAGISTIDGLSIENDVETNIIVVGTKGLGLTANQLLEKLKERDILAVSFGIYSIRFVTHYDVSMSDMDVVIQALKEIRNEIK